MLTPSEVVGILEQLDRGNRDDSPSRRAYSLSLRSFIASQIHHLEDVDDPA